MALFLEKLHACTVIQSWRRPSFSFSSKLKLKVEERGLGERKIEKECVVEPCVM
jgi:hypothetical protein